MTTPAPVILAAIPIEEHHDVFWGLDPKVLWLDNDRLLTFMPAADMTRDENFNAITRFFLYLGVLTALNKNETKYFLLFGLIPVFVVYCMWQYENPEHTFGSIFRFSEWQKFLFPNSTESFTSLADYKPSGPYPQSKGEYRLPVKGNPYVNPLQTMWGTHEAILPAANYLEDPKVAAEIDALQSDWYDNNPGDLYENQQGQRELNFTAVPGSLVPDWDSKTRDWLIKYPEGYKTVKEGGNRNVMVGEKNSGFGRTVQDGWRLNKTLGVL